jgi:hypothetical protein
MSTSGLARFGSQPAAMTPAGAADPAWRAQPEELPDRRDGAIDAGCIHIEVRRKAQPIQPGCQNALARQVFEQWLRPFPGRAGEIDEDHVGLRRLHLHVIDAGQALGQPLRERVVLRQPVHMMIQRIARGGGQHPRLAHASAGHLSHATRSRDQLV